MKLIYLLISSAFLAMICISGCTDQTSTTQSPHTSVDTLTTANDMMYRGNPEHTGVYDNGGIEPTNIELWQFKMENSGGGSISSSPVVSKDIVYVGNFDNNLYAIDAITGREKWRFNTGYFVMSSPAVSNGVVFVEGLNSLYAIDAIKGTEKWRFDKSGFSSSSPAVSKGVVYVGDCDGLYAIDTVTGTERWKFDKSDFSSSSPAVSNGVVYVGGCGGGLYAINAETGIEIWQFKERYAAQSSPAVFNDTVYMGINDGNLYAIDAMTGREKWHFETGLAVVSPPAISEGNIYISKNDTNLYALDAITGREKWRFNTGFYVMSSPAVSNGVVYVSSCGGGLYAIDAITGTEKWCYNEVCSCDSSPAVSNGVVYIRDTSILYAIGQNSSVFPKITATTTQLSPLISKPATEYPSEEVLGVDVSDNQRVINWRQVYDGGYQFVFCRATLGDSKNGRTDDNFLTYMNDAKDVEGMYVGAYHIAYPDSFQNQGQFESEAEDEANHFLSVAGDYISKGYLRPMLDIEQNVSEDLGKEHLAMWINKWMYTVQEKTGVTPILYLTSSSTRDYADESLKNYNLWVAHYTTESEPTIGPIWNRWDLWQYTEEGVVAGIQGNADGYVDIDKFNGNLAELVNNFVI